MAEDLDSDTSVGFKRRITDLVTEIEDNQHTVQDHHSNSLSLEQDFSAVNKERESMSNTSVLVPEPANAFQKKVKSSSSDELPDFQEKPQPLNTQLGHVSDDLKEHQEVGLVFSQCVAEVEMGSVVDDDKRGLRGCEDESQSFLKIEENKDWWVGHEVESITEAETHVVKLKVDEKVDGVIGNDEAIRCSLKIEVIDETALIESACVSRIGSGCGEEGNGKKNVKQEVDGKKEKRSRRRGKGVAKKVSETNGKRNVVTHVAEARKNEDGTKRVYSREEMEALRFVNVEAQRKMWKEVHNGFGPSMVREYNDLVNFKQQKHPRVNFDPRQRFGKMEEAPGILGEVCSQNVDNEIENMDPTCGHSVSGEDCSAVVEGDCSEDGDSDEDYVSIQRPAFLIRGEPNFDSGPPEDGLEYLRRVRWEAAQIPKVKVAKLDRSKLNKEQTVYMPQIPDIAKCPQHLLPLKQWEDAFLADFSELRLAVLHLMASSAENSDNLQSTFSVDEEDNFSQLLGSTVLEKFDSLTTNEIDSCQFLDCAGLENSNNPAAVEVDTSQFRENSTPKTYVNESSHNDSTFSAILGMDSVARVSMLRRRIGSLETMSTLSRNDCAWLFGLCAAVDTPLDAETCAALRCLLRKCASLRAGKSELDDEVVMLNILATISGRYFGQSEN